MSSATDRPDTGLPEAVQRVKRETDFGPIVAEEIARAARADYPDVVRNAKAEALDEAARDYELMYQQPGSASGADWLRRRAAKVAAIREGRTDGE